MAPRPRLELLLVASLSTAPSHVSPPWPSGRTLARRACRSPDLPSPRTPSPTTVERCRLIPAGGRQASVSGDGHRWSPPVHVTASCGSRRASHGARRSQEKRVEERRNRADRWPQAPPVGVSESAFCELRFQSSSEKMRSLTGRSQPSVDFFSRASRPATVGLAVERPAQPARPRGHLRVSPAR